MSSSKVVQKDTITPHRLAIAILIREFWTTRETGECESYNFRMYYNSFLVF